MRKRKERSIKENKKKREIEKQRESEWYEERGGRGEREQGRMLEKEEKNEKWKIMILV